MRQSAYERYCQGAGAAGSSGGHPERSLATEVWITATNLQVERNLRNLYAHLLENHYIAPIVGYDPSTMDIFSRDILSKIHRGEPGWERGVPPKVAELIKERKLFGLAPEEQLNLDAAPA